MGETEISGSFALAGQPAQLSGEFQASEQFCLRKYNRKQLKKTAHIGCLPSRYACAQHICGDQQMSQLLFLLL